MQKSIKQLLEIKLVGITCRTSNANIFQSDPATNKIAATVQTYFHNGLAERISHRKNPGITYCVYMNYESDFTGDYTYFIGEEVTSFNNISAEFEAVTIPMQNYAKFTVGPGAMPDVCIQAWQDIWKMTAADFSGERAYIADFEVYDERSSDHQNVIFDIYIGIKK